MRFPPIFLAISLTLLNAHYAYSAKAEPISAESLAAKIAQLEAEINQLKQQQNALIAKTTSAPVSTPHVTLAPGKGLKITSPDKTAEVSLRGYVQAQGRLTEDRNTEDQWQIRRLRVSLEARSFEQLRFVFTPDFAANRIRTMDAFIAYQPLETTTFRIGKMKPALGLERLQSAPDVWFIERGLTANLSSTRDTGLEWTQGFLDSHLTTQLGLFNGAPDMATTETDTDAKKDVIARVMISPFAEKEKAQIGIAGNYGVHEGTNSDTQLATYLTPGQQTFFTYRTGTRTTIADGKSWRIIPQGFITSGPAGLFAEYAASVQKVRIGAESRLLRHHAWQVAGLYVLTGEDARFLQPIMPKVMFAPNQGHFGALALSARIGGLYLDPSSFPVFADPATSAEKVLSAGTGLHWYLNPSMAVSLTYDVSDIEGGAFDTEHAWFTRAQYRF